MFSTKGGMDSLERQLSKHHPGPLRSLKLLQESLWSQNLFIIILKYDLLLFISSSQEDEKRKWSFPETTWGDTATEWMQKQIWDSNCLLLGQTLKGFTTFLFLRNYFCFGKELFFIKNMLFIFTCNEFAIVLFKWINNNFFIFQF